MAFYSLVLRVLPKELRKKFKEMVVCSTVKIDSDKLLAFSIFSGIFFGILMGAGFLYFELLLDLSRIVSFVAGFITGFLLIEFLVYVLLSMAVDSKTDQVEESLPEALQLMSSNIRAGLTTDKALLLSARPEFGPLATEIKRVGRETMMGRNLASALMDITKRTKSDHLNRTMELIVSSIESGGELADLLDQTANDLRDQQLIQKEISAGVLMYVIFIFIAIGIGAPALFSVSTFLVDMLASNINAITSQMPSDVASRGTISLSGFEEGFISFIKMYSIISLVVSSFLGGLTMGLIRTGKIKEGVKYVPLLLLVSLGIFFLGTFAMDAIFGSMITT